MWVYELYMVSTLTSSIGWLQVEHPVTEWISQVNIPACQIMIGMGIPLWRIPDIRRLYGKDPLDTKSPIDCELDPQQKPSGWPSLLLAIQHWLALAPDPSPYVA